MSTLTTSVRTVKPTRVLFDSTVARKVPRFGRGLLRSLPTYAAPYTVADDAWWAAHAPSSQTGPSGAELDRLADIAAFADRYDRGTVSF